MIASSSPILMMVAIILTMMSSYAALDLFYLLNSSDQNKRLLFLGGTFSMGMGIWVMSFFGMLSENMNGSLSFNLSIVLLSLILGISFAGMAFYTITGKLLKITNVVLASFFLTMAVLSNHIIGLYSMNLNIEYNTIMIILSVLLTFCGFLFVFWLLFFTNSFSQTNQVWLKPIGAFIIAITIVQGHFLLKRASPFEINRQLMFNQNTSETLITYLILFFSIIILGGLISSSAIINKRLIASDTHKRDITAALDEHSIVAITDPNGIIRFANEKLTEISKYSKAELIGEDHRILNSGFHSKEFFKDLWATIGSGKVWKGEIQNRAKDGTLYWVDTTIVPFLNSKGKPYQYVSIRTDITARKKARSRFKEFFKRG